MSTQNGIELLGDRMEGIGGKNKCYIFNKTLQNNQPNDIWKNRKIYIYIYISEMNTI